MQKQVDHGHVFVAGNCLLSILQSALSKTDAFGTGSKCLFSRDVRLIENKDLFIYLPACLDTGPAHEQDSGSMRGAIPSQSHNP